jgi:hypothetical protein
VEFRIVPGLVVCEKVLNLPAQFGLTGTFAVEVGGPVGSGKLTRKAKHFSDLVLSFVGHEAFKSIAIH